METGRRLALRALNRWRKGAEFANRIVSQTFGQTSLGEADRAFALELFYGVLRNLTLLDFWIGLLRSGPLEETARDLLRLGLYQIMLLETAAHAAVFETVALAPARVRKLVNAVLRRALRERVSLTTAAEAQPVHVRYSEPAFLVEKWRSQFGDSATLELCQWNNRPAPVYARVNQLRLSVPEFLARHPGSFLLPQSANFVGLPDPATAAQGADCYIQDPSTALACELLSPKPGESVLDACAAPGGKAAYLAEMMDNRGLLVTADRDEARVARVGENFVRLKVANARIVLCDWAAESSVQAVELGPQSFDKILVDAPCTNTGVMRRRVDVRWRLRADDFARMARAQLAILRAVGPLLRPGGSLVYSTCSLEPEENEQVVGAFLREQRHFRLTSQRESLPFRDGIDGAYAALLES
jgi:16S rRNA (cytosine967-C5)-methyltransferase